MTPERWHQVTELFHAARASDPARRDALLAHACRNDPALQREVAAMLAGDEHAGAFENAPLFTPASRLEPGFSLGPYRIERLIGAGGMGEVYRARDTTLGRDVAIKVLPPLFTSDPERLARFEREARMLAALNHPHIGAIYGVEDVDGVRGLVLELVEGPTLADRLTAGPLPVTEALTIARQIAEALDAAHEKGIIHRDLKPANVKVTPDGKVKVLDFGLAKAFAAGESGNDPSNSPTLSAAGTMQGVILGTAAYMSPEQARGKAMDKRTDIWAFGCLLYELLTGQQAFQGDTITEILAAVLRGEPEWTALPAATPTRVRDLLRHCLQKDKALRLRDAGDACIEIQEALAAPSVGPTVSGPGLFGRRRAVVFGLAVLVGAVVTGLAVWTLKTSVSPTPRPITRTVITLPPGQQLAGLDFGPAVALSPDGTHLAYVGSQGGTQQLYLRPMDSWEAKPIPGTEGAINPFFSPDGQWVGFFASGKLRKVSMSGGAAVTLGEAGLSRGASWGGQGIIAFGSTNGSSIQQVQDGGGGREPLTRPDVERANTRVRWPDFLPGGKTLLFATSAVAANWTTSQVAVESVATGERWNLIQGGTHPRFAPSGHLVYAQGGSLMAVPFDPDRLAVTGTAVPVANGVLQSVSSGAAQYSFSATGSLVYVPGAAQSAQVRLVWVDRNGLEQPLAAPAHAYEHPRLSPNGRRVAVGIVGEESQVWTFNLSRETLTRLTLQGKANGNPTWTTDGKWISFYANNEGRQNLFWQLADGSGGLDRLTTSDHIQAPMSSSPDGKLLAFLDVGPATGWDIWVLTLGDRKAHPFLQTPFSESAPRFSPDGRWLAYFSNESGRFEVYMTPYPGPGRKEPISTEGGTEPVWNPNGRELFYRSGDKMMAVDIVTQPGFAVGKPHVLFEGPYVPTPLTFPNYDVSSDGQRFLMLKPVEQAQAAPTQINVVSNWFEELKQRVPAGLKK